MRRLVLPVLAAVAVLAGCGGTAQPPRATEPRPPEVRLLQRVGSDGGWVLTDTELGWVTGTRIARRITPGRARASLISAVFFLDRTHGWAGTVATERTMKGSDFSLFRTTDGGATWQGATVRASPGAALVESLDFVDARHGFLLARDESSSNFSVGELFRTADGGATWTKLEAPSGGVLRFVNPSCGFVLGGADNGHLFMTIDGGGSWHEQSVVLPRGYSGGVATYGAPTFVGDRAAVLPVTVTRGSSTAVVFYSSSDAGRSWHLAATRPIPVEPAAGARLPIAVADIDSWVAGTTNSSRFFSTDDGGTTWREFVPDGARGIGELDFSTATAGWGLANYGSCTGAKSDTTGCVTFLQARATTDGGRTWEVIRE